MRILAALFGSLLLASSAVVPGVAQAASDASTEATAAGATLSPVCAQAFTVAGRQVTASPRPPWVADEDGSDGADGVPAEDVSGGSSADDPIDLTIRACASLPEWLSGALHHPEVLGGRGAVPTLVGRCADPLAGLDVFATCRSLGDALATPTPSPSPGPTATPTTSPAPTPTAATPGQRDKPKDPGQDTDRAAAEPGADGLVRLPRHIPARVPHATSVRYFPIKGRSAVALMRSTQAHAQRHCSTEEAIACVSLRWRVSAQQAVTPSSCTITGLHWSLLAEVDLPRWARPRRVDPALLAWWRTVVRRSAGHEATHIRIQRRLLRQVESELVGKPCSAFGRGLARVGLRSRKQQRAFDRREYRKPLPTPP